MAVKFPVSGESPKPRKIEGVAEKLNEAHNYQGGGKERERRGSRACIAYPMSPTTKLPFSGTIEVID